MTSSPLCVSFLWHMHQPLYRDPMTGVYRLPWVRLHGAKDYLDMAEMLREFPAIRQNFNIVPSLLEQLTDYSGNRADDLFQMISRKKVSELTAEDRIFILENFFLANWENMIKPFPRYYELLMKRGTHPVKSDLSRSVKHFSDADFRDLQVLFNLCWIDPLFREKDPSLQRLCEKGRNYSDEDRELVLRKQRDIIAGIIPAYRDMAAEGRIELSFSPYYHPILPLLCDSDIARVAMPGVTLPRQRFVHPEDADRQIAMGMDYFEGVFGYRPKGMWPSEGSVSEEVLRIAAKHGISWVATDEGILSASLGRALRDDSGRVTEPRLLYRPYSCEGVSMVFRDHTLSDLIGFVYSQWEPEKAAEDFIGRLLAIADSVSTSGRPYLVPIILDGENAWEYYKNDGRDFLMALYEGLSRTNRLKTITISEFLREHSAGERLKRLHPGSWINANFGIWIGHEEDNLAWDHLSDARDKLVEFEKQNPGAPTEHAWRAVYAAEGSDWNWWYGDDHATESQEEFDELFRLNLMKVYREIGKEVPPQLSESILRRDREIAPTLAIRGFIKPKIDGIVTSYYEWYQSAQLDVKKTGGSMHKAESLLAAVYFGFDRENLFLRIDPRGPFVRFEEGSEFSLITLKPAQMKIVSPVKGEGIRAKLFEKVDEDWKFLKEITEVAAVDVFEIGIPFADLRAKERDEINLFISVGRNGEEIERCPWRGHLTLTVPTADFEAMMWY